jgi:outer membrane protein OmpA-like peptidoglycan-associated protein/opacity protein-like surface antigen
MKKVLMSLIIVVGLFIIVTDSNSQIYLGGQFGPNYESGYFHNTTQELIHTTGKLNLFVGGLLEFNFSDVISLQAELNYMQRGNILAPSYATDGLPIDGSTYEIKLYYFDMPVMLKYKFEQIGNQIRPYIIAGITFGSLIDHKEYKTTGVVFDNNSVTKSFNMSIDGGVGIEYKIDPQLFAFADLRYSSGITNIIDESKIIGYTVTQNTGGIQMHLGVKFRVGGCSTSAPIYEEKEIKSVPSVPSGLLLAGKTISSKTQKPVKATVIVENQTENSNPVTLKSSSGDGSFELNVKPGSQYNITIDAKGYISKTDVLNIPDDISDKMIERTYELSPIEVGKIVRMKNIFFDFNKSTLKPESFKELNKLVQFMNDNPDVKIEITGHTDNVGSNEYNLNLSKNRAKAVADYVISKISDSSRVLSTGYGASQPIESNDSEEGRANNRRVEFKILND